MTSSAKRLPKADRPHSANELGLVLDTALDAVIVMNADGTVADWNDRAVDVFGWSRAEAIGRVMADLIIPATAREAHWDGLRRYLDTGEGPILRKRIEVLGQRKSGEEVPVELSISPVRGEDGLVFVGCLRDISARKRAEQQQKLLLDELNHRVKNMLSVVTGIASQTARTSSTMSEFNDKFVARLQALNRAHGMLTADNWVATQLHDLIVEILSPYEQSDSARLSLVGPPVALKPNATMALSLILHELVTNATKHGAFSIPEGRISIHWDVGGEPSRVELKWHESGVPDVSPPRRSGFGTRLIEASVKHDLRGDLTVNYGSDGVRYNLRFSLE
jgi:PAS domain S-box-containing protein